jgi:hypothetical protein
MASAAAIAAGLGQAFQDINRQNLAQQEVNLRKSAQEFEQQAYTQQQTDLAAARGALLDAWQPPPKVQAPMPGTPSQPMMQAFGAPGGMPGMLPPQALSPGAPPPPMGMGMPPGPPPGVGAPPMMPQGRPDGPPGTLIMNPGLSPAQRQMAQADMQRTGGAPPAQPPQPFTASPQAQGAQLPGAPAQAGVAAPPPRDGMMIPDQMLSVPQLVERLNENKRLTPNQRGLALSLAFPMIQQQQTQEYKEAQLQLKTQDEILKYTREKNRELEQNLRDVRAQGQADETARYHRAMEAKGTGEGSAKAPSGYRWSDEKKGELEPIPGGPADPKTITEKKNAIQISGGRESVYTTRVLNAANQAARDLENIVKVPMSVGPWYNRTKATGFLDAGKDVLERELTPQEMQTYEVMATALQRNLAAIETQGIAQGIQEFSKGIEVVAKPGETELTRLHKLAQIRQIVEAGIETTLANPRVATEQKDLARDALGKVRTAVPFTHGDLIELTAKQAINPDSTLKDVLGKVGDQGAGKPPHPGWTMHEDKNKNKAWVSPDGKQFEEVK